MRVIVTGSRSYHNRELVRRVLDELYDEHGSVDLVHGGCRTGADWHAEEWAIDRQRGPDEYAHVRMFLYRADWNRWGGKAGPLRNKQMVAGGADLCVAFFAPPPAANRGTTGCVQLAQRAGIPVRTYGRETPAAPATSQENLPL